MIIALTGRPGVGKTTVFTKVIESLRRDGVNVYGFVCPEVREGGRRIGFKIVDLVDSNSSWLAVLIDRAAQLAPNARFGRRIGRYLTVLEAEEVGLRALSKRVNEPRLLAIDEIGPMELSLPRLRKGIVDAIKNANAALLVVHRALRDIEIMTVLRNRNSRIIIVSEHNRNELPEKIAEEFRRFLLRS